MSDLKAFVAIGLFVFEVVLVSYNLTFWCEIGRGEMSWWPGSYFYGLAVEHIESLDYA